MPYVPVGIKKIKKKKKNFVFAYTVQPSLNFSVIALSYFLACQYSQGNFKTKNSLKATLFFFISMIFTSGCKNIKCNI